MTTTDHADAEAMIGKRMRWTTTRGRDEEGVVIGYRPTTLTNVETWHETPAYRFRMRRDNGSTLWTCAMSKTPTGGSDA